MMISEVLPGLYIGDYGAFKSATCLEKHNIGYVVSLVIQDPLVDVHSSVRKLLHIPVTDEDTTDLLSWFEPCTAFINEAIAASEEGEQVACLVHCQHGISRSATAVMAYIMMTMKLPCSQAFRMLKRKHRPSSPNKGFQEQLKMLERMQFVVNAQDPEYRLYRLNNMVDEQAIQGVVQPAALAKDPASEPVSPQDVVYRCKKCRRVLFAANNQLSHSPGQGQVSFRFRKRDESKSLHSCSSWFFEPMAWMSAVADGVTEGKILCPKCDHRAGTFNWAGSQCSCGAWITPAFKVPRSKVDRMGPIAQIIEMDDDDDEEEEEDGEEEEDAFAFDSAAEDESNHSTSN